MLRVHSMTSRMFVLAVAFLLCQFQVASAVTLPNIPSLTVRLDAGAGVTFSSGNSIQQWDDQQTSDLHNSFVKQDTTDLQPKLISGAVNGLPAVRFDGDLSDFG